MSINVGDVAMLREYGNDKFLVCKGWFTYRGSRRNSWYFKQIPDGTIVPFFEVDLDDVVIVNSGSTTDSCNCDHNHHHDHHNCEHDCNCPPKPPRPPKGKPNGDFTTVNTLDERNQLCFPYPPDGKIVRVNNVKGEVKYYIWNAEDMKWANYEFPTNSETQQKVDTLNLKLDVQVEKHNDDVRNINERISELGTNVSDSINSMRDAVAEVEDSVRDTNDRLNDSNAEIERVERESKQRDDDITSSVDEDFEGVNLKIVEIQQNQNWYYMDDDADTENPGEEGNNGN